MLRPITLTLASTLLAACTSMDSTTSPKAGAPDVTARPHAAQDAPKAPAAAAPAKQVFPYTVERAELPNGLKVLMVPTPSDGLVSYWTVVRTGSRDEVEEGVTGFAHFFEHMMFRGTDRYPGKAYDRIVNGIGADANAFTTDDFTAYHLSFSKDDLPKVAEIEADRFQNLNYPESVFKTESGAVYGEYRKNLTSPFNVLFEALQETAFEKHTYKHTTMGFEEDIKRMPEQFEYSKTFFQRFYRPENCVLLITGDVDPKKTLAVVEKEYGGWKKGYQAPEIPAEPAQTKQKRVDVPYDYPTLPILTVNFKSDAFRPEDKAYVAGLLVGELGFGETSPIYKKLVLEEQTVETLGPSFDMNRDQGLWTVYAMVKEPKDVPAVEREIWATLEELRAKPVDAARLAAVRSRTKYGFLSNLSTPDEVASSLARFVALSGDVSAVDQMFTTLEQVTAEDVRKAAQKYLTPERSTVAVLHTKGQEIPGAQDERSAALAGAGVREASAPRVAEVSQAPVLLPAPAEPNVAFKLWFQVGAQDDPAGKEGLAALTASMLTEGGTKKLAYDAILAALFPLAAGYGASVDKEMTVISGEVHKDHVDTFTPLFLSAVVEPGFRAEDFERLRSQAVSYIENTLRSSSDEELAKAALYGAIFARTPYEHIATGTVESLKALTVADVEQFWKQHYTRDNLVIGVGGSYAKGLPERLQSDLGKLAAGRPAKKEAPQAAAIEGRNVLLVEKAGPGASISLGVPIDLARGERDFYALWIANSWLGEHRNSSSHLYQVIRESRGLNYGNYSYIESFPGGGRRTMPPTGVGRRAQIFEVWLRTLPRENALFALRAALREVDMLVEKGMSKEDFEFTRKFLKGYVLHFAESGTEKLGYAIDDRFYGLDGHLATFRKMLDEITHEEVNAAIKKHLQTKDLVIAIVTGEAAKMKEALASGAPSPVTYPETAETKEEVLAEDKLIEAYPLDIPAEHIEIVPVGEMFGASGRASG